MVATQLPDGLVPRAYGRQHPRVVFDALEALRIDLRPDIVEHEACHALRQGCAQHHAEEPAERSADDGHPVELQELQQLLQVGEVGARVVILPPRIARRETATAQIGTDYAIAQREMGCERLEIAAVACEARQTQHGEDLRRARRAECGQPARSLPFVDPEIELEAFRGRVALLPEGGGCHRSGLLRAVIGTRPPSWPKAGPRMVAAINSQTMATAAANRNTAAVPAAWCTQPPMTPPAKMPRNCELE